MNDHSSDPTHNQHSDEQPETAEAKTSSRTEEAFRDLTDAARKAFDAGMSDAREAADSFVPRAREEFEKGTHDVAYAFAYVGAFGAALLDEITPGSVRSGFETGAAAGRRAATESARKKEEPGEESPQASDESDTVNTEDSPSPEPPQGEGPELA